MCRQAPNAPDQVTLTQFHRYELGTSHAETMSSVAMLNGVTFKHQTTLKRKHSAVRRSTLDELYIVRSMHCKTNFQVETGNTSRVSEVQNKSPFDASKAVVLQIQLVLDITPTAHLPAPH